MSYQRLAVAAVLSVALLALLIVACLPDAVNDLPAGGVRGGIGIMDATPTALSGDVIFLGSAPTPAAVYFSVDDGSSFELLWNAPGRVNALDLFQGYLYAAVDNEIWRTPANIGFTQVYTVTEAADVWTLEVCGDMLWAGADDGKIYSTEDGVTWEEFYDTEQAAVYDIEVWSIEESPELGSAGSIATGDGGMIFQVWNCEITGSGESGDSDLITAAMASAGGEAFAWLVQAGGTGTHYDAGFAPEYYTPGPDQYVYSGFEASVEEGMVLPEYFRCIGVALTPTPAPSGDGLYYTYCSPYGLKNGLVERFEFYQGIIPYFTPVPPTPTPWIERPTIVNTGHDRVNEIVPEDDAYGAYYMAAGGSSGGSFFVDWSETFTDTGEFLSVVLAPEGSLGTAVPGETPVATATPVATTIPTVPVAQSTPQTQDIIAEEDTFICETQPDTNFGNNSILALNDDCKVLIRWPNIRGTLFGQTVTAATLRLFSLAQPVTSDGSTTFGAHVIYPQWRELTPTWNDSMSGVSWSSPGASTANVDYASSASGTMSVTGETFGWIDVPLSVATVNNWIMGVTGNYGVIIRSSDVNNDLRLTSSEWYDDGFRPRLILTTLASTPTPSP